MLSSTSVQKIECVLKQSDKCDADLIDKLVHFFGKYTKNYFVYPGVIKRNLHMNIVDVYEILDLLEKNKIVETYYELWCTHCQKSMGTVKVFNELPETYDCDLCDEELDGMANSIVIYKIIVD